MGRLDDIKTALLALKKTGKKLKYIFTSERSEWSSYYQSYMGRLDEIKTALQAFKKTGKKLKYIFTSERSEWSSY